MKPSAPALLYGPLFLLLCVAGALLMAGASPATHPFRLIAGFLLLTGAVAIAARPAVYLLTRKSGSLFFPGSSVRNPPPAFSTAEARRIQGDFPGALQAYESIIDSHPGEPRAYVAVIEMAFENLDDPALAKRTLGRGFAAIGTEGGREHLKRTYDEGAALRSQKKRPDSPAL